MMVVAVAAAACGGKGGGAAGPGTPGGGGAAALPGPCVEPMADARIRLAAMFAQAARGPFAGDDPFAEGEPSERPTPDLDGDGAPDRVILSPEWLEVGASANLVYVMRGACGHFVGDLLEPTLELGPERHAGLADVSTIENGSCEGARCGCDYGTWWYRFDGTAYVKDEAASTDSEEKVCPDEE